MKFPAFLLCLYLFLSTCSGNRVQENEPSVNNPSANPSELISINTTKSKVDSLQIQEALALADSLIYSHPDSAKALLNKTAIDSRYLHYQEGIARSYALLGKYYSGNGLYDSSLTAYHIGLEAAKRLPTTSGWLIRYYQYLSFNYHQLHQYDSSRIYLYKGLDLAEQDKDNTIPRPLIVDFYIEMSRHWSQYNNKAKSMAFLKKAEVIASELRDTARLQDIDYVKGATHVLTGNLDSALPYALKVIESRPHSLKTKWEANYMAATILIRLNRNREALPYLHDALAVCKQTHNQMNLYFTQSGLAAAYSNLGDYAKAEQLFRELLDATATATYRLDEVKLTLYQNLGITNTRMGRYERAVGYYDTAILLRDSFYAADNASALAKTETLYEMAKKDKLLAAQQIKLANQKTWIIGISGSALILLGLTVGLLKRKRHKEQMEHLKAVMQGEQQERKRLARELHDGVGGMLAAIKMNVSAIQQPEQKNDERNWQSIMQLVDDTAEEVRKTSHSLMPDILHKYPFPEAIRVYCDQVNKANGMQIDLQFLTAYPKQSPAFELALYRILQELLQNIIKHAQAQHATIQFRLQDDALHITVEDDGQGFEPDRIIEGLGLQNIRSRVAALQGRIEIESTLNKGTICYIALPVDNK